MKSVYSIRQMVLAAMFLAIALVLPFITGQIPQIGSALCPLHLPVLLCGFFCGPLYGMIIGLIVPLLRFALFGMPPLIPSGVAMCLELAAYGGIAGWLYRTLPQKKGYVFVALIIAMIAGRVIWGAARVMMYGLGSSTFGWNAFITGAVLNAIPGIIAQLVLVPLLVISLKKFIA